MYVEPKKIILKIPQLTIDFKRLNFHYHFLTILDKLCVVTANGGADKTKEYCPYLVTEKSSEVECVFGTDK